MSVRLDDGGLRRLIAAVLWRAVEDAAIGLPEERSDALLFIGQRQARDYAEAIDLPWPPTAQQIAEVRRVALARLRKSKCPRRQARYRQIVSGAGVCLSM